MSIDPAHPIGFKEWARVCDHLATGATSLILRKGGIAEGRGGFDFGHTDFWLFPTYFHNENAGLKPEFRRPTEAPPSPENDDDRQSVSITTRIKIEHAALLTDWQSVARLAPFHVWEEHVIKERFEYKGAGLKAALVRAYSLPAPLDFPYEKGRHGGCRSWLNLPGDLTVLDPKATPVLPDQTHASRIAEIKAALGD